MDPFETLYNLSTNAKYSEKVVLKKLLDGHVTLKMPDFKVTELIQHKSSWSENSFVRLHMLIDSECALVGGRSFEGEGLSWNDEKSVTTESLLTESSSIVLWSRMYFSLYKREFNSSSK